MTIQSYLVRVFHSGMRRGSYAGVVVDKRSLKSIHLKLLAKKLGVPDVAWIQSTSQPPKIRFYTPACEINFCGHATLAAGLVMQNLKLSTMQRASFQSHNDLLKVSIRDSIAQMQSQIISTKSIQPPSKYLHQHPWFEGGEDFIVMLKNEKSVRDFKPDFKQIMLLKKRGLVITASDRKGKYVLRFFAPQSGINEDPCTGSVQSALGDLWRRDQKCSEFKVTQHSREGGSMSVRIGHRYVYVAGRVQMIRSEEIELK